MTNTEQRVRELKGQIEDLQKDYFMSRNNRIRRANIANKIGRLREELRDVSVGGPYPLPSNVTDW